MMYNLKIMKEEHEIIKEFCIKFRTELTIAAGIFGEFMELVNCDDYIEFTKDLSNDEFIGNYLTALFSGTTVTWYRPILNGEKTFEDLLAETMDEDQINLYREKLNN